MNFLTREKIAYTAQALLVFLNISKQAKTMSDQDVENFKEKCVELMEQLTLKKLDAEEGALGLNQLIEQMNRFLDAPYPVLPTDNLENFVKGEIVAFEHYLNQELKANHLSIKDEAPLFDESLDLWEQVGTQLSPKESVLRLTSIIDKMNQLLPENERYPRPE